MRKLFTIVAILGLATGLAALTARADGTTVTYVVDGTFSADPIFSSTSLSNPGDSFTLTFSVPSDILGPNPLPSGVSDNIGVTFTYTDLTTPSLSLSQTCTPTAAASCLNFFTPNQGGLFGLQFTDSSGNLFMFELVGAGCFTMPVAANCGGYTNDTMPPSLITGGPFTIDDTLSVLGEESPSCVSPLGPFCADDISGTVTATPSAAVPEPSSLLLLGSGFLALGGFARKRLIARFN
ncbi:MAG: PEP-CTERM sorting domain-containing protein [Candidatus Acidiferrales bacterium]